MRALPDACGILVGLCHGRIDMDRAQDLVQSDTVLHGCHKFRDDVSRVLANDGDAQDVILAGHREHFHHAVCLFVGDSAIEVVDAVARDLEWNLFFRRFGLVQTHPRNLGVRKRRPRNDGVVGLELSEPAEQSVHGSVPCLMRSSVRELVRPRDIAAGIDVGIASLQVFVGFDVPALVFGIPSSSRP